MFFIFGVLGKEELVQTLDHLFWGLLFVRCFGGHQKPSNQLATDISHRGSEVDLTTVWPLNVTGVANLSISITTQDRTCVAGRACLIEDIYVNGSLHVLDTCGSGWTGSGNGSVSERQWLGSFTRSNASEHWMPNRLVLEAGEALEAGEYRLCWCADGICEHPDEMQLDVGTFSVIGANSEQDRTCVSGQACSFEISGHYLHATDEVLITATCGVPSILPPLLVTLVGESLSVSTAEPIASGGQFRLCWCSGQFCIEDVGVDVGSLSMIGPSQKQTGTCVSGQLCVLEQIKGNHLSPGDSLVVLDTCGVERSVPRFPNAGRMDVILQCQCAASNGDSDLDGVKDCLDACPFDPNSTTAGACGCGVDDVDSDFDGIPDCLDQCPSDPSKSGTAGPGAETRRVYTRCENTHVDHHMFNHRYQQTERVVRDAFDAQKKSGVFSCSVLWSCSVLFCPRLQLFFGGAGVCGCNVAEVDADLDGIPGCLDLCPSDPNKYRPGICPGPEWLVMSNKVTHQSSTQSLRSSHLAVDASISANFYQGSCTWTNTESSPWWYVDLGFTFQVSTVRVTPRSDCCDSSLVGLELWTSSISSSERCWRGFGRGFSDLSC